MSIWAGKAEDNSMDWTIKTGDIVFYTDEQKPLNGDICMVVIKEHEELRYSVKRVYFLNDCKVLLQPDNFIQYTPETIELDKIFSLRPLVHPLPKHNPPRFYIPVLSQ